MIRGPLWPITMAACTNSRERRLRNSPRTSRATGGHDTTAIASVIDTMSRIEDRHQHDRHGESRDGLEELGEAHQEIVDPSAIKSRERPDGDADHDGDGRRNDADEKGDASPIGKARRDIPSQHVGAERKSRIFGWRQQRVADALPRADGEQQRRAKASTTTTRRIASPIRAP